MKKLHCDRCNAEINSPPESAPFDLAKEATGKDLCYDCARFWDTTLAYSTLSANSLSLPPEDLLRATLARYTESE